MDSTPSRWDAVTRAIGCPKCGCWETAYKYVSSRDFIRRTCERCGYVWTEEPVQKEPIQGPTP